MEGETREAAVPQEPQTSDRRSQPRFVAHLRGDETIEIWLDPARPLAASILDESIDGVGLLAPEPCDLQVRQIIDVVYRGARRRAVVRNLQRTAEGVRVGLLWKHGPC